MFQFSESKEGLEIYFDNHLIFNHRYDEPCFYVGKGQETISAYRGNYAIEDYISVRTPLKDYEIIDEATVVFTDHDYRLTCRFMIKDDRLVVYYEMNKPTNRFWMRLYANRMEKVYGCGIQASYFNLRGKNFPLWTSEPGVGRDKRSLTTFYADLYDKAGGDYYNTYYPETTFISTRKYWVHVDSYAYADFNFRHPKFHELHFWDIPKKLVLEYQKDYLKLIERLTDYTGRPPKLPDFVHDGIILGVQGGTKQVLEYLTQAEEHDVKVNGLWIQDWAGYRFTSFGKRLYWNWVWNSDVYPNLRETIETMKAKNVRFMTYICPFLLQNETLFNEAKALNYLVLNQEGTTYIEDFGEFFCGLVDLTNKDAFDWYKNIIKKNLIDLGVGGWMADFGEYLPVDAVLHNGVDAKLMHNRWPVLWAKCNYEAVKESGKLGEVVYFMRAGGHGSQRYATSLWAGDQSVNWEIHDGIPSVIPASLSAGIIGNPFIHSDIGGYTSLHGNIRTKELFERWVEMNVFSAYMRTHEGNRPSENFQFYHSKDTLKMMARMSALRVALKPYIQEIVVEASEKGYPLQRPLFFHYLEDDAVYDLQYEYLFGPDLYVKPVVKPNVTEQTVYLPDDEWIHLFTQERYQGGTFTVPSPIGYPPVFYRKHSKYADLFETISTKFTLN